jgi:hypothetical protein
MMREEDMKEFRGFSQELRGIFAETEDLHRIIAKEGFTEIVRKRMAELTARHEKLLAKQKEFGRKHRLL